MSEVPDAERSPRAWLSRPVVPRPCADCGRDFLPPWPSTKYCAPVCSAQVEATRRQRKKRPAARKEEG